MSKNMSSSKIEVKSFNPKTGKITTERIPFNQLISRQKPVSKLNPEQITRIKTIYTISGYLCCNFENWARTFTFDTFPENEIRVWEKLSFVFLEYTKQNDLNLEQKKDVLFRLLKLSFGEKPKDKLSKDLLFFWENLSKVISETESQDAYEKTENYKNKQVYENPWNLIDFTQLAFVCQKYINQHEFSSEEEEDIYIRLIHLMAGDEPKDDLSRELLYALENEFDPQNITDDRERVVSVVVQRKGQAKFRSDLLKAHQGKCAITSFTAEKRLLEAAHIIRYLGNETNHPSNGILLRVDIHRLFDQHSLSIHPKSYEVVISPKLCGTDYEGLGGKKLILPEKDRFKPNSVALEQHYQTFLQKSEK